MSRLLLALLLLLALAVSSWLWFGRDVSHPSPVLGADPAARVEEGSPVANPSVKVPRAPAREELIPPAAPGEPSRSATLEVLVLRLADDEPVEDVEVVARAEGAGESFELSGRTDEEGLCRLEHATAFRVSWARACATPTTSGEMLWLSPAWVGEGKTLHTTVRVSDGATLVGRVVDGGREPVAGARVLGWCSSFYEPTLPPDRETLSDEEGRFEIPHLGARFRLVAEKEGLGCSQGLKGELAPGARAEDELELVLQPPRTVQGRVLGEHDEPLRAHLTIEEVGFGSSEDATGVIGVERWRPVEGEAQCDEQGAFELGPVPPGRWHVRFEEPEHLLVRMRMPARDGEWIVRLQAGCGVQGVVLGSDGEPVAEARVALRASERAGGEWHIVSPDDVQVLTLSWREARSAEDGSFVVGGVECGEGALLMVAAPGHAPWLREKLELRPGAKLSVEVRLEPGLPLAGRVVESDGTPVSGAPVVLEGERTYDRDYDTDVPATWEHLFDRGETYTDGQGRFRFEDLYAGRFQVRVHVPGDDRLHQELVAYAGEEDLEIVLDRAAMERVVLEGQVVDRRTGEPVRAFTVTPMVWDGSGAEGHGTEVVDDEGRFRIAGLEPGRIELNVRAPGYATWRDEPRELEVGVQRYDVRLAALRSIDLLLLQADGSPYEGRASARFARPTGEEVWVRKGSMATNRLDLRAGVAQGVQLPAELLQVAFDLSDGEPERVFDLDLERDPSDEFEFRVRRADAEPLEIGAAVFSATADYDASGLERKLRAGELPSDTRAGPVAVPVRIVGRNARGVELVIGTLEPVEAGFRERWSWPGAGRSSDGEVPFPAFETTVPGTLASLTLEADGHEPLELTVDPTAENGGLPRILVLRRR